MKGELVEWLTRAEVTLAIAAEVFTRIADGAVPLSPEEARQLANDLRGQQSSARRFLVLLAGGDGSIVH